MVEAELRSCREGFGACGWFCCAAFPCSLPRHVPCLLGLLSFGGIQCFQVTHRSKNHSWRLAGLELPTFPCVPELQEPGNRSPPQLFRGLQEGRDCSLEADPPICAEDPEQLCCVRSIPTPGELLVTAPPAPHIVFLCFNLCLPIPSPSFGQVLASVTAVPSGLTALWLTHSTGSGGGRGVSRSGLCWPWVNPGLAWRGRTTPPHPLSSL